MDIILRIYAIKTMEVINGHYIHAVNINDH